jgi:GH25 family lysozyme M1 (1,4-beta-N-acetylmuramidase)
MAVQITTLNNSTMKKIILLFSILVSISVSTNAQTILGIDVSHYQGTINWTQVYNSGKVFAYAQATQGYTYNDAYFTTNMVNGNSAGVKMGAYHLARPDNNTAANEASHFLSIAGSYIGTGHLPPALDLEPAYIELLTPSALSTWVQTWLTAVQNATGITPIIYCTHYDANNWLSSSLNNYKLWIANYETSPTAPVTNLGIWSTWTFNQYSEVGSVSGISGNVDLDVFNGNSTAFNNLIGSAVTCTAPSPPTAISPGSSSAPGSSSSASPTLSMSSGGGTVSGYNPRISQCPYGGSYLVWSQYCTSSSVSVSSLPTGNLYRWNADATCDCAGTVSGSSNTLYFNVPPVITYSGSLTICSGSGVTLNTTAGNTSISPTQYQWYLNGSPVGSNSSSYYATQSGNYTVVITYSCGSTSPSNSVTVTVNPLPASPTGLNIISTGCNSVSLSWNAVSGSGITYEVYKNNTSCSSGFGSSGLGPISNTSGTVNTTPGTQYFFVVVAINSCGTSTYSNCVSTTTLSTPTTPGSIGGTTTNICAGATPYYSISPVSGATSYTWTLPSGWTGNSTSTGISTTAGSSGGAVTVTANNSCGSSSPQSVNVTVVSLPITPIISASLNPICAGQTTVLTNSNTCSGCTTNWSDGGNGNTHNVVGVSNISIYAWAVNTTCSGNSLYTSSNSNTINIGVNQLPTATVVSGGGTFCSSTTLTASGGNGGTIYWQGTTSGGTSLATPLTTQLVSSSGTYYFNSYNGCGWGTEGSATVTINSLPTATTVNGGGTFCNNATLTASGGNGGTIYWQGTTSGGTSLATPLTSQLVSSSGTYYFNSYSSCGWGTEGSATVTINSLPTATTVNGGGTFCNNTTLTAIGGSGGTIYWQGTTSGGTSLATPLTTQLVSSSGTYYFNSYNGCGWGTEGSATVTINSLPTATANATTTTVCAGATVTLTGGGASTYTWTGTITNGVAFTPTITNTYIVTGTDANGCSDTAIQTINVNPLPIVDAGNNISITQGNSTTIGGTPTASGNGSFVYSWTPSTNLSSTSNPNPLANPTISTTYFVSVTDGNGCSALDSIIVTVNAIGCTYSISDSSTSFNHLGGTHSFNVLPSNATCTWIPVNLNTWFQVNPSTQQTGNGTITITADTCNNGIPRTGTFTIAGITYTVTQTCNGGTICNPPTANFVASQTTGNCPFTVDFFDQSQTTGTVNYQWTIYNGSGSPLTPTQQDPTGILYNVAGSFLVKLQVTDSCGTDTKILANYIIVSCTTVGIDNIGQGINIAVYPNPTNEILNVLGNDLPKDIYKITLTDVLGQTLFQDDLNIDNNKMTKQIDVKQFSNGIYILTISSSNARQVFKINKQ